jgi:tetratricopeptide (TPR) repeat protein
MFASALFMHRSYLFDILASGGDLKIHVAEYYFAKSQFREAIELFNELLTDSEPTAALFQKLGYCYQQTSDIKSALDAYLKSDIIQPDNLWTTKKIALCYKLLGDFKNALEYYKHADFIRPEQQNVQLQIANCYMQLNEYAKALDVYTNLELEDELNLKVQRAIVWCSFISGNKARARYYSQRLVESEPTVTDYLNAAYIEWSENKIADTALFIRKSIAEAKNDKKQVYNLINNNLSQFKDAGIVLHDFNLIWDGLSD